ncbi:MAG: phage polymerase-related protein [Polaromonas sp.]|nr:phage polymerase-related protein [Polaromonas sp.]
MSLNLDPRQRAMLMEMGVRVWQPLAPDAPPPQAVDAIEKVAASADAQSAGRSFEPQVEKPAAPDAPAGPTAAALAPATPGVPATTAVPAVSRQPAQARGAGVSAVVGSGSAASASALPAAAPPSWHLGEVQALYAETTRPGGGRWLVLAETPASALERPVFDGEAGRLLANMLRAARLHQAEAVLHAPLVRRAAAATMQALQAELQRLIERARPDVVLVMGRLAAQALLESADPLGRLRGQVHALHGARLIVTYDAPYLLRVQADKPKAWDDLCLAMSLAAGAGAAH